MLTYHLLHILIMFFKQLINHIMELMTAIVRYFRDRYCNLAHDL